MFFQPGDLNSDDKTTFNIQHGVLEDANLTTNTFWLDATEGSASCDLPIKGIIGEKYHDFLHGK